MGNNSMLLNSPLIPTITNKPASDGNVMNLKYTLPSGVIVYSPKLPVKAKKPDHIGRNEDLATANLNVNIVFHL